MSRAGTTGILPSPLYVICDVDALAAASWEPVAFVDACREGGASLFQLRAKTLDAGAYIYRRFATHEPKTPVFLGLAS